MKRPLRASSRSPYTGDPPPENWIGVTVSVGAMDCQVRSGLLTAAARCAEDAGSHGEES